MKIFVSFLILTASMGFVCAQNQAPDPVVGGWPPKNLSQNSQQNGGSIIKNLFRRTESAPKAPTPAPKSTPVGSTPKPITAPAPTPVGSTPKTPKPATGSAPKLSVPDTSALERPLPKLELPPLAGPDDRLDKLVDKLVDKGVENRVNDNLLLDTAPLALPPLPAPITQLTTSLPEPVQRVRPHRKRVKSLYTLGPGDTVTFSTFERSDLSRTIRIAPDGTVSYLQAIAVNANGLTVDQLRDKMQGELRKFRRDFKLIVTPDGIDSKQYAVLGRVREPGTFPIERPVTVLEAIARAQGVETGTIRGSTVGLADFDRSFVSRGGRKLDVNMSKLYEQGDMTQNAVLQPNDYVYVASALKKEFYILGAVTNPGRFKIREPLTVASAISLAGGFNNNAYRMKVLIIRGDLSAPETTVVDMKDILNGKALDQPIKSNDIVFVARRPFDIFERVVDSAITTYVQTLTAEGFNQNFTAFSL